MSKHGRQLQRHKHLTRDEIEHLDNVAEAVQRVKQEPGASKQPRFTPARPGELLTSTLNWVRRSETQDEPYLPDSRKRDKWLREFTKLEPYLEGIVSSIVSVNQNRGWFITGGRNQVNRYTQVLHNYRVSADLVGWRFGIGAATQAFYMADMGSVVETGREGEGGPLRALYHTDSARCRLSGDMAAPLEYFPARGGSQKWKPGDYFRLASMPNTDEVYNGLGFCFCSRCLELAKLLAALLMHDQESLAARAPKGLLLLHGIAEDQWKDAMLARRQGLEGERWRYYEGVAVLCTSGMEQIDAKLVALSNLPANFDMKVFIDQLIYGYALCSGYDPREFWPVSSGALGTATETETQHRKATLKGGGDFTLAYQEQLQQQLPDSLHFEFEQRDIEGELADAQAKKAKLDVVLAGYMSGDAIGREPLFDREESRQLAVMEKIIPPEWTEAEEEMTETDTGRSAYLDRLRSIYQVRRGAQLFPDEPIVRYCWPTNRIEVLWSSGAEVLRQRVWRATDALYKGKGWKLKKADVKKIVAGAKGEIADVVQAATA